MTYQRSFYRIFAAVFLSVLFGGTAHGASVTVENAVGQKTEVRLPVRRVVALNSDVIEVMRSLKAEAYIVGVFSQIEREAEFWGNLARLPKVGSWRDPDPEAVSRVSPDLVVGYGRNPGKAFEKKVGALGIQVLRLDFYQIDTLEREVRILGTLLDRVEEAERFCAWYRRHMEVIRSGVARVKNPPAVYVESYSDYHAAGPGSGGNQMCAFAGGRNIAEDMTIPYPRITSEWVVSQNPEVVIKATSYGNGYAQSDSTGFNQRRDVILARPAWHHITAVAQARVHVMDSAIWTGPRAIIGIAYMVRWMHPEIFRNMDPEALHQEYLEKFQRVPYKGVYVSEPLREKQP